MPWGGNYDLTQVSPGATILFPAQVPGGLFSLGDLHAAMGEHEATFVSIECAGAATVRLGVRPGLRLETPRIETADRVYVIGLNDRGDYGAARRQAARLLFELLTEEAGLSPREAYTLISAQGDLTLGGPAATIVLASVPRNVGDRVCGLRVAGERQRAEFRQPSGKPSTHNPSPITHDQEIPCRSYSSARTTSRGLLDPAAMLDVLQQGFADLSEGKVVAPGRDGVTTPDGFLLAMPGWLPGAPIGVKLVAAFHGNPARGLPGHQALICLFDPEVGTPLAVMDGTYITALRTAGGAAVSARLLARKDAATLAIIGGGVQGDAHLQLLPLVRDVAEIRVWSRSPESAERVAAGDPRASVAASAEEAVRDADIVCLCTTAQEPPVLAEWLAPGTHVTSVGFNPPGGELDRVIVARGHLFVESREAFAPPPVGCWELQGLDPKQVRSWAKSSCAVSPAARATRRSPSTNRWATPWRTSSPPAWSTPRHWRKGSALRIW